MIKINPIQIIIILVVAGSLTAGFIFFKLWRRDHHEMVRAQQNQEVLLSDVKYWKLKDSTSAASLGALSLSVQELKNAQDSNLVALKNQIVDLGIKVKNVKNASSVNFQTETRVNTYLHDSTIFDSVPIKTFHGATKFNEVQLTIWPTKNDSLELRVITRDKMTQVVYKESRGLKFWTKDWWRKRKLRQVVHFQNPDTDISYPQYIEIKRNNK